MRRRLIALLGAGMVAIPLANGAAAVASTTAPKAVAKTKVVTKKGVGLAFEADRWGTVQVTVTARVTMAGSKQITVKYTDLGGSYTYHTGRSQYIMSQSLPLLRQEFLSAHTANVQNVSGATYTTQAFEQSLQSALSKLHA